MSPVEVFLSHSSQDHEVAGRLARVLTAHGVPIFFAPHNIAGAQQWQDVIGKALLRCDWFLVLLSPDAVDSMWVRRELRFALGRREYDERIIPVLHRACDLTSLSWVLSQLQMVDLSGDFAMGCRDLLKIWGLGLRADVVE